MISFSRRNRIDMEGQKESTAWKWDDTRFLYWPFTSELSEGSELKEKT
jgi:hypothetical protein